MHDDDARSMKRFWSSDKTQGN